MAENYKIHQANWPYANFQQNGKKAFLSLVAEPNGSGEAVNVSYGLTVTEGDYLELFQEDFTSLDCALEEINQRYGDWRFYEGDKAQGLSGDGCESCSAH